MINILSINILSILLSASNVSALLLMLGLVVALYFVYYVYIKIAYDMATKRHRDPLFWALVSVFASPLTAWILLLILGDND